MRLQSTPERERATDLKNTRLAIWFGEESQWGRTSMSAETRREIMTTYNLTSFNGAALQ